MRYNGPLDAVRRILKDEGASRITTRCRPVSQRLESKRMRMHTSMR